jgi:hypothetical protein
VRAVRLLPVGLLTALVCAGSALAAPATAPVTTPATPAPPTTVAATVPGAETTGSAAVPVEVPPPIVDHNVVSSPLVVIPPGCSTPAAPVAVFLGTITAADATTARYSIDQLRAGTLDGYAVGTLVDVRYDDDIRFLHTGDQYLIGAAPDPVTGLLHSKVRVPAPLFGGDAVIGLNDTDITCPRVEDGVKTLHVDGTVVDTGVLAPLKTAKQSLARAILKPLGIAFGVLVLLTAIKMLAFAMVQALRDAATADEDRSAPMYVLRDRQHHDADDEDTLTPAAVGVRGEPR